jgi:radical SAM superfamily enzyme YgiQ (UPF0313 family)
MLLHHNAQVNVMLDTIVHSVLLQPKAATPSEFTAQLKKRQRALLRRRGRQRPPVLNDKNWPGRTYRVLAVLAPVMTTHEEKIEFPGDPMCLYSALSYSVSNVQLALSKGLTAKDSPYNDFCPAWGVAPTKEYRLAQNENGLRSINLQPNTDETVFDPRVWNDETRQYLVKILNEVRPLVVLISSVSPAHRYALEIAECVKGILPDTLVIFGGRHADETTSFDYGAELLHLAPSSLIQLVASGQVQDVVDFLVAGQSYYSLDILLRAISLGIGLNGEQPSRLDVVDLLVRLGGGCDPVPGRSLIVTSIADTIQVFPTDAPFDLTSLPSPYRYFAIRARFPVFAGADGQAKRTAHILTANACPYRCSFCSESGSVIGQPQRIRKNQERAILDRIVEYVGYGAEALFFDESIFLSGDFSHMLSLSETLSKEKRRVMSGQSEYCALLASDDEKQRFIRLEWGAQLTVNLLRDPRAGETLKAMFTAGCTYLYVGIESLAEAVIVSVDKYKNRSQDSSWESQVTQALTLAQEVGIRVGSSVLFGLDGETSATIEYTIAGIEKLIEKNLLYVVSPNILTYHPATRITRMHGMEGKLDYSSTQLKPEPPFVYFEEAYPGVVSRLLTESDIWNIHRQAELHWSVRNRNKMKAVVVPSTGGRLPPPDSSRPPAGYLDFELRIGDTCISRRGRVDASFAGDVKVPRKFLPQFATGLPGDDCMEMDSPSKFNCPASIVFQSLGPFRCTVVFTGDEFVLGKGLF